MRVAFLHACMLAGAYEAIVCGDSRVSFYSFSCAEGEGEGEVDQHVDGYPWAGVAVLY